MRKFAILAVVLTTIATSSFAQGFFYRLGVGYAFPQAAQTTYETPLPFNQFTAAFNGSRTTTTYTEVYNVKPASFSAGVQGTISLGYMFTDHIGLQLDAAIGMSPIKYTFHDYNVTVGGVLSDITTEQQANSPFLLTPSLVLQTGTHQPINGYVRMGLVLPLSTKMTQDIIITNQQGTGLIISDDFTWDIKNSFSLGFAAAAGVQYKISERFSVWGELSLLSMSVYIKEQNLTAINENGQSISPAGSGFSPQTIKFSKTASRDSTFMNEPTYAQPFSNIGFSVGIRCTLSSGHSHTSSHGDDVMDRPRGGKFH